LTDETTQEAGLDEYRQLSFEMAMRYLKMGWSIFPVRLSDKMPAIKWEGYQTVPPTEAEVTGWYEEGVPDGAGGMTKAFNLGLVTGAISGVVVADCDTQEALAFAINEANLFSTVGVHTTRGQHLYFKHPGDKVQNKVGGQGRDWPDVQGLDLRGDGGYVVVPPSLKFDDEGKFKHQYTWTFPEEDIEHCIRGLTTWPGVKVQTQVSQVTDVSEWSFDNLRLSAFKTYGASVWDDMAGWVKKNSRKMREGDGRNAWMTRYLGECIASGMEETQAREACNQFQKEFFEHSLDTAEAETILQSVLSIDRRNHPDKYAAKEAYDNKNDERKGRAAALRLITPSTLAELKKLSAGAEFLIDPFIPPQAIVQVVGFNGHGKTIWLLNMLWAASQGVSYGSGHVARPLRTLYLDAESSTTTLAQRIGDCVDIHGGMSDDLSIWSAAASGEDMNLTTPEGLTKFTELVNEVKPQIVVIDTVRQAWMGMEENSPHSWTKVNNLAMACRNAGMSVVLVHHRNKPGQNGQGREAGSTAQLKDLDVQIFVTKVVEDNDQAKREACLPDAATQVIDFAGNARTVWSYLRLSLPKDYALKYVFELSFGKVRQSTENHVPTFVGMAQDMASGKWKVVGTMTPRQKAIKLAETGRSINEICAILQVSQPVVTRWITPSSQT
jgi:hypothetical protein